LAWVFAAVCLLAFVTLGLWLAGVFGGGKPTSDVAKSEDTPIDDLSKPGPPKPNNEKDKKENDTRETKGNPTPKVHTPINILDRLLTLPQLNANGEIVSEEGLMFGGDPGGTMVPAFFAKDKMEYKKVMDDPLVSLDKKDKLKAERQAELESLLVWVRSEDFPRRSAYEMDRISVPPALIEKVHPKFVGDDKVRIRSLIDARCGACHSPGHKQEDFPLTNYQELARYLEPFPPPKK
jgi:hypothetical protein